MSRGKIVGDGAGQYKIGHAVGAGAFSTVYECTRLTDGRRFAVKVISKNDMRRDPELEDALCREINSMELIRHSEFITNMIDKLVSPRNYYIVMDLAKGGPLMPVIQKSQHGLHPNRARLYFRQLLMGLSAMHGSNVVHRDIKPENLLLDETKTILKISDFGFGCFSGPERALYRRCGTVRYTAPEFYTQDTYLGRQVDLWAAGVTLYVMLFNAYPFGSRGDDNETVIAKIMSREVQFPRRLSQPLEHLLRVMLRKDPNKRWTLEKVKAHAWVMGIDEVSFSIPRNKRSSAAKPRSSTRHAQGDSNPLLVSDSSQGSPSLSASPTAQGQFNAHTKAMAFLGAGRSPPSMGTTPNCLFGSTPGTDEATLDKRFLLHSSLLEVSDDDGGEVSDDEDYIAGGMHRRVRSCPVLPTVFFAASPLALATNDSVPPPRTAVTPAVVPRGGAAASTTSMDGPSQASEDSWAQNFSSATDDATERFDSMADAALTGADKAQMLAAIRQERMSMLQKALRLTDVHSRLAPGAMPLARMTLGNCTGLSNSSFVGILPPVLTEAQRRDTFYSDMPLTRHHRRRSGSGSGFPHAALLSSHSSTSPSNNNNNNNNTAAPDGAVGGIARVSRSPAEPLAASPRLHGLDAPIKDLPPFRARRSPHTTPPMRDAAHSPSPSSPTSRYGASTSSTHSDDPKAGAGGAFQSTKTPRGGNAAVNSDRFQKEPLWRRLGVVHLRIFVNFCIFWATLLAVGALRVLFDVDARRLPLPQAIKDLLERVLAPPFEEQGDSLGTEGGGAAELAPPSLSRIPRLSPGMPVLQQPPATLRRRKPNPAPQPLPQPQPTPIPALLQRQVTMPPGEARRGDLPDGAASSNRPAVSPQKKVCVVTPTEMSPARHVSLDEWRVSMTAATPATDMPPAMGFPNDAVQQGSAAKSPVDQTPQTLGGTVVPQNARDFTSCRGETRREDDDDDDDDNGSPALSDKKGMRSVASHHEEMTDLDMMEDFI